MRRDIEAWIGKDRERQRVYLNDPVYNMQAQVLSSMLDAVELSLQVSQVPEEVIAPAMVAAVTAVLGSIESAEERTRRMQEQVNIAMHQPQPSHRWDLPGGPLSKEQGGK